MRKSRDGIREQPPAWVHYKCFACWATEPGNVLYSKDGEILHVYKPEGRFKVPGPEIYVCCICRAFCCGLVIWFAQPSNDQPSCRHDPNTQAVRSFSPLYHNRPMPKAVNAPSRAG